jgi:hypothetical protein
MSAFCALAFCLVASGAWGDSISIQNSSFEQIAATNPLQSPCNGPEFCAYNAGNPMPGWTVGGTNASAGQFEPSSFYFNLPLPDGSIVAYINSGSISQTLTGISLLPDSVYTLSVEVGRRFDVAAANYSLNLLDGSNVFCTSGTNSNGTITAGTFADITLTCATGATVPGGFLGIELTGDGRQINFDDVQLSVTTSTVATPEPSVLALTLLGLFAGGLLFLRSRRMQYLPSSSS